MARGVGGVVISSRIAAVAQGAHAASWLLEHAAVALFPAELTNRAARAIETEPAELRVRPARNRDHWSRCMNDLPTAQSNGAAGNGAYSYDLAAVASARESNVSSCIRNTSTKCGCGC